jgi:hypothetical protein
MAGHNDFKHRMLRMIEQRPRRLRDFSCGDLHDISLSPQLVERYAGDLQSEGMALLDREGVLHITDHGRKVVNRPTSIASLRVHNAYSTPSHWTPPRWEPVRAGAEDHKKFRSLRS